MEFDLNAWSGFRRNASDCIKLRRKDLVYAVEVGTLMGGLVMQ
jgi:hypothetical protein